MEITVRKFQEKDIPDMVRIWNEVVEEGVAFPQTEYLALETGKAFLKSRAGAESRRKQKAGRFWGCIFFIPTMSGGAAISAMPASRFLQKRGENRSAGD